MRPLSGNCRRARMLSSAPDFFITRYSYGTVDWLRPLGLIFLTSPIFCAVLVAQQASATKPVVVPTFYRDVLPILQQHCQTCHRPGEIGPMPLLTYKEAQTDARSIAFITANRKMPPWFADRAIGHFANDPSLTAQEIAILNAWSKTKAPAGDPHDAPPPRLWTNGWSIPQPDAILKMTKPAALPAQGDIEYTY